MQRLRKALSDRWMKGWILWIQMRITWWIQSLNTTSRRSTGSRWRASWGSWRRGGCGARTWPSTATAGTVRVWRRKDMCTFELSSFCFKSELFHFGTVEVMINVNFESFLCLKMLLGQWKALQNQLNFLKSCLLFMWLLLARTRKNNQNMSCNRKQDKETLVTRKQ